MNETAEARHEFARVTGPKGVLLVLGEVLAIMLAFVAGGVIGGLTGILAFSPILGTLAAVATATGLLRAHGKRWADVGLRKPERWLLTLLLPFAGIVATSLLVSLLAEPLKSALGLPPRDLSLLVNEIEGNLINYLLFLIPVSWGSAAIGEELLARGYLLNRISSISGYRGLGTAIAIFVQALIFAVGHLYQGLSGAIDVFTIAVVFGCLYAATRRNLWACILMHGIVDTIAMTLIYTGNIDKVGG